MKAKFKKIKLTQIDWVDFSCEEKQLLIKNEPQIQNPDFEVVETRTEYQILKELGQLDLLD